MGVAVFSGMIGVTFFGLLLTPVFYVLIRRAQSGQGLEAGDTAMSVKVFLPSLLVLALSACAVGPDYKTQPLEAANVTAAADAKQYDHAKFEGIWWQQFEDPTLNQLVTQSLNGNRDLRVAFARLRAARAIRDDAANDVMPVIT
eukprot:gene18132-21635_t